MTAAAIQDNADRVRDEFHRIEVALKLAGDALLERNDATPAQALKAIRDPEITNCIISTRHWLDEASITTVAGNHFWQLCEMLGNRSEPLNAPLHDHILYHIKKLVDAAQAWDDFHAMPQLREKYKQLSLWEGE